MKNNRTPRNKKWKKKKNSPAKHRGFLGSSGAIDQLGHALYRPGDDTVRLGLLWPPSHAPSFNPLSCSYGRKTQLIDWFTDWRRREIAQLDFVKSISLNSSKKGFFGAPLSFSEREKEIEISDFLIWKGDKEERLSAVRSYYFDFKSNPSSSF